MQDHILMEFANPIDGGPMPATISAFARLVPADKRGLSLNITRLTAHAKAKS